MNLKISETLYLRCLCSSVPLHQALRLVHQETEYPDPASKQVPDEAAAFARLIVDNTVFWQIKINNLTKSYGSHVVLNGLDFCVQQGEIFALLGINGAG